MYIDIYIYIYICVYIDIYMYIGWTKTKMVTICYAKRISNNC